MGCCCFDGGQMEQDANDLGSSAPTERTPLNRRVSPSSGQSTPPINSSDIPRPPVFYVIVGRGPAAVIDHTTLRGGPRLGQLPVLHIGFANPWPQYLEHGMGQPAYLLSLPGFHAQPNAGGHEIDGGLHSRDFGAAIDAQMTWLRQQHPTTQVVEGWVAWVHTRDDRVSLPVEGDYTPEEGGAALRTRLGETITASNERNDWPQAAFFRLLVFSPRDNSIGVAYAAYIDFCTGPGRPIVLGASPALAGARTPPWLAPEVWPEGLSTRRILNGVDAIVDAVQWAATDRVCVTAGGGVGLNAAEKARNNDCWLDWFGRTSLVPTFDNPRNHTFLAHPETWAPLERGQLDELAPRGDTGERPPFNLLPPRANLRFGAGATLAGVTLADTHAVVRLAAGVGPAIRDRHGQTSGLADEQWECSALYLDGAEEPLGARPAWPSRNYQRLVVPNGQGPELLGQPFKFTPLQPFVALGQEGRVRLLGAAAQVYTGFALGTFNVNVDNAKNRMWAYRTTLPVSAVPDGFILSGSNIAVANGYFERAPNTNVNTMTEAEITAALAAIQPIETRVLIAQAIVARRNPSNGYANIGALEAAIDAVNDTLLADGRRLQLRNAGLRFAYPAV
jgi:hypothetical protein